MLREVNDHLNKYISIVNVAHIVNKSPGLCKESMI